MRKILSTYTAGRATDDRVGRAPHLRADPVPRTMRAAAIDAFGPAEVLTVREVPVPELAAGEVLVRVEAAGVQLTDAAIREGWTPPGAVVEFPQILGNEFAGTVVAVAPDVADGDLTPGVAVAGFRVLGCYAEYVAVPATQVARKPESVDWLTAGALSASGQTAHTALEVLRAATGETLLVHGAAGGVGTMAVQLARYRGLRVVGTGSADSRDHIRALGATPVVYGDGETDRLRRASPGGYDLVLDAAGHGNLETAVGLGVDRDRVGTIVEPGLAAELGCRWITSDRSTARLVDLLDLCVAGDLRVVVRDVYPLDGVADAHRDVETGHGRGKNVLAVGAAHTPAGDGLPG